MEEKFYLQKSIRYVNEFTERKNSMRWKNITWRGKFSKVLCLNLSIKKFCKQ